jgi:hypothetical protein
MTAFSKSTSIHRITILNTIFKYKIFNLFQDKTEGFSNKKIVKYKNGRKYRSGIFR